MVNTLMALQYYPVKYNITLKYNQIIHIELIDISLTVSVLNILILVRVEFMDELLR